MRLNRFNVLALLLLLVGLGQAREWKLDPAHSSVTFTVKHMVITKVVGKFDQFEVTLTANKDDFTDARITATIPVNSINTANKTRDDHLRSADFFDAAKYPTITFVSKKIEKVGDNQYRIAGDLTIHGITRPVVLDATLGGIIQDFRGNTRAGWEATTTINRFDYGLQWNKTLESGGLVVGKEIKITIQAEFVAR